MKLTKIIIVLLWFCFTWAVIPLNAYPNLPETELSWKNVPIQKRASAATHYLYLDNRGLIWVGSNTGLSIYDGIITHAVNDEKLVGAQIYAILEYNGNIYLGTNHGLLVMNISTGIIKYYGDDTPKEIRCLLLADNVLWIGSLYGVYYVNLDKHNSAVMAPGLPHKSTYSIIRDSRGIIYAGTFNGLAKWDPIKKTFSVIKSQPDQHNRNLFVNCLLESEDGNFLYVGCEGYLYKYHIAIDIWESFQPLEGNNIKSIARLDNGHILVGTDNGIFDNYLGAIKHYRHDSRQGNTLADNDIWCILADKDQNVWAGHDRGFSISSHSNTIRSLRLSTIAKTGDGNEIHSIHRDKNGNLWLGGTNGILRMSSDNNTIWCRHEKSKGSLSHNRIRAIDEDENGSIWLSTDGGLNRFNPKTNSFDVFQVMDHKGSHNTNWVYAFEEDEDSYWIGGFLSGLHRVEKSKFDTDDRIIYSDLALNADTISNIGTKHHLENDFVNDIKIDNAGSVWILLFKDDLLIRYNPIKDTMCRYNIYEMAGFYPSKIEKDKFGRIWCVFNGGAIIFDDKGKSKTIHYANNNEDEAVITLGAVGEDMWVSTLNNLWKIDGKTLEASVLPIPQKAFTAIYEDQVTGKILLGGTDEIIEIDSSVVNGKSGLKGIQFIMIKPSEGKAYQYDLNSGDKITIPYGGNLSLIVSSLDYSPGNTQRYMYKLADERNDTIGGWTILPDGVNEIPLSDLKMGNFEILIKRVGMSGPPTVIPLKVNAPILLSWWAILLYIVIAIALVFMIVIYFKRKEQRRYQEEERIKTLDGIEKKLKFLSNISHDLKTPLSMIIGPVSLLREKAKDQETKKTLETVYGNAVRLNNLIHKTIELQHLEDVEDNMLILSTFDVVEFCKGVFDTFKENHPSKNFIFHTSCVELFIEGDAVKFESVMTNLFSNACKYSDDGATITCGISRQIDNVEIVVSDDGIGIEENDQPLVFQRMFRAPSTSKLKEGTGLGLYLIKQYLELMKGSINMYSQKGQGTSFIINLPITTKEISKSKDTVPTSDEDKPKILIVEDNSEISSFIATLVGDGYSVLTAENGRSGLAIASSFLPDLIIADEMMPIMSGLEMCRRLKQISRLSSVPIIMLTAKTDNDTENESVKLGIDIFMPKPFDPNLLLGRIKHLLKSRNEIREKMRIQSLTETKPIEAESTTEKQLAKIAKIIEDNISDPDLNVNLLCEKSEMPQKQLYRMIKKYMGVSPLDYIRRVRLQKAAMLLSQKRFTVSEISYMVGFKTPSYFAKCFQSQFGVKPSQYQSDDENAGK